MLSELHDSRDCLVVRASMAANNRCGPSNAMRLVTYHISNFFNPYKTCKREKPMYSVDQITYATLILVEDVHKDRKSTRLNSSH